MNPFARQQRAGLRSLPAIFFLLAAAGFGASNQVVLQLPFTDQFEFAGVYAAEAQGYFQEEGLTVEVRPDDGKHHPIPEINAGHAQYGIYQAMRVLRARLAGDRLVVLAAVFQHSPYALATLRSSGIRNVHDLIGRRVAIDPVFRRQEIQQMLRVEGVDPAKVQFLQNHWEVNELTNGYADAMGIYLIDGPYDLRQQGCEINLIRQADYGVDFYGDVLFTDEPELEHHPARVKAMRRAILRGWDYALRHPEEMIDWILQNRPERPKKVTRGRLEFEAREVTRLVNPELLELGSMNPGRWKVEADYLASGDPQLVTARLHGFIYQPAAPGQLPTWVVWFLWGAAAVAALCLIAIFEYYRMQRLVRLRTAALLESEERQRELFELAPAPIVVESFGEVMPVLEQYRREGVTDLRAYLWERPELVRELFLRKKVVLANRQARERAGFQSLEQMQRQILQVQTAQGLEIFLEELAALWDGVDRLRLEKTYRSLTGEEIHALVQWEVTRKNGQRDLGNVRLVFTDITEQRRADRSLRESEERYRELFEQAVGGVYRSDLAGSFISINPAFARLLGYLDSRELLGDQQPGFAASLYVQPNRRKEFLAQLTAQGRVTNFESEVRVRDGRTVWISENARAVRDAAGQLQHLDGFVTDITVRRRLEAEMLRASKLESVGILAGGIAHDFNNILAIVMGNLTLAQLDAGTSVAAQRWLKEAERGAFRARDLTQQLLTFAKGGDPVRSSVALPVLLRESTGFALHGARARPVYELAGDLWPANADKGQIGQVVQNLVINAVQAMPQGGCVTLHAANVTLADREVGNLSAGDYVRVGVEDTGVGIPSEHLTKIFDPYFTTKQTGSGLGLATVYSIIRKHQGHIEVESRLGEGTKFVFWLPAARLMPAPEPEAAPEVVSLRGRILFMDDETSIREMAGMFMARLGLQYDLTADGAETVAKYRAALQAGRAYDLVIMDLTVPGGMGGKEAMQELRTLDPMVRAVVASGYSRDPVMANFRAHGFCGMLPKPYSLDQLQQTLRESLGPGHTRLPPGAGATGLL